MEGIFWIEAKPQASLAIVLRPNGDRYLEKDLLRIKTAGIHTVVSLLEAKEAAWLGLAKEEVLAERVGLTFLSYPFPDMDVPPDPASFRGFVTDLAQRLRSGEAIGIHCRGSIGRSTVVAACTLIHLGWDAKAALAAIEKARGEIVPNTLEQEEWILRYRVQIWSL
jgi:protein-tyrosine phosphatase